MRYLFKLNPYNQQRQFEKPVWVYPAHLAMYATYLRKQGHTVYWGTQGLFDEIILDALCDKKNESYDWDYVINNDTQIDVPFEKLPFPDRIFTDALNKRWQSYGNYKFHPATHMMASNLCWYGKCTFCIDTKKLETEPRGLRTVDHCLDEIDNCIDLGIKEIFDDSGTFPLGKWLEDFCNKMIKSGMNKKVVMGCNMRVQDAPWRLMKMAGFRFILMGIESANQFTLDKIKKSQKADEMVDIIRQASEAGLEPHGTFMSTYPWENEEDEQRTIDLCHFLLKKGYLKTAQASIYSPPRTAPQLNSIGHKRIPKYFEVYKSPEFIIRKIKDIKRLEDFTYLLRGGRLVLEENWRKFWLKKSASSSC